jgi:hypothetical protein
MMAFHSSSADEFCLTADFLGAAIGSASAWRTRSSMDAEPVRQCSDARLFKQFHPLLRHPPRVDALTAVVVERDDRAWMEPIQMSTLSGAAELQNLRRPERRALAEFVSRN